MRASRPSPALTEGEHTRLIAWAHELRAVHARLREALDLSTGPAAVLGPLRAPFVFP